MTENETPKSQGSDESQEQHPPPSPSSDSGQASTPRPAHGGFFAQLLEFFGMTPNVQSGPTGVKRLDESNARVAPRPAIYRCRACYNPASWSEEDERWRCHDHPQAEIMDPS